MHHTHLSKFPAPCDHLLSGMVSSSLSHRWGTQDAERLCDLSGVTQPAHGRAELRASHSALMKLVLLTTVLDLPFIL